MKAKLVKYPYDEKKYRWDTWYQGKEFRYYWDESLPNNFETIEPYIETEEYNSEEHTGEYKVINYNEEIGETAHLSGNSSQLSNKVMKHYPEENVVCNNKTFTVKLQSKDSDLYNDFGEPVLYGDKFYYRIEKLDSTAEKLKITYYRTVNDVFNAGLTLNDVACFTNNFNINALAGYFTSFYKEQNPTEPDKYAYYGIQDGWQDTPLNNPGLRDNGIKNVNAIELYDPSTNKYGYF